MNAKNKKLLAIVGVAAVLLIVIGVSVSMLGKGDQPSGTDPAAAPTDVTTEDVSQPPEEETTTPTVEVPDVSAPENTNQPQNGDTQNGSIYIEGFGWIPDEGGSSVGIPVGNDGDELTGNQVGSMG